ncbi:hypothetical protein [Longimicrobium sp.]|uniref:hypothetical protein n=1 Tax=Longimicrobium sp. TaxID=2029185 RepID=UPI002E2F5FAF|nr:hypothetical protein [Longimicrobium sp.]HEX6039869.1 hypothetical protein [Longimicrobium sp.]
MKKQIAAVFGVAALALLGACGSTPTSSAAAPDRIQADEMVAPSQAPLPQDTATQRVPNMMGSGN